jgi:hypothetical protein
MSFPEFEKLNDCLSRNNVVFMIIGGFAVNYHGFTRATNDLDIWLKPSTDNFTNFLSALKELGFDIEELESIVFDPKKTFIRIPFNRFNIEFLTEIPGGISFTDAYKVSDFLQLGEAKVHVIGFDHLILNKKATNRPKDIQDVIALQKRKSI